MHQYTRLNPPVPAESTAITPSLPPPGPDNSGGGGGGGHREPQPGTDTALPADNNSSGRGGPANHGINLSQRQLAIDIRTELWRKFDSAPKIVIPESESGDDSELEEEGPVSYARVLAPYAPFAKKIVDQHNQQQAKNKAARVSEWLDNLGRIGDKSSRA